MTRFLLPLPLLLCSTALLAAPPLPAGHKPLPAFTITLFHTPESVLFDVERDRFLVSNINGDPLQKDNNGYITVVGADGQITQDRWIAGGVNKVTLHAPKGTAVLGKVLYVADLDTVRMFDVVTGAPAGEVKIPGASFLNDVVASEDEGRVYVSDTGVKGGKDGFVPTGTDAVWVIQGKKATKLAAGKDLKGPNGLRVNGRHVLACTFNAAEVFQLDAAGKRTDVTTVPAGGLDGLHVAGDGSILVGSWEAGTIFRGTLGGTFTPLLQGVSAPADFAVDGRRGRIWVPRFTENIVEVYDLPPAE